MEKIRFTIKKTSGESITISMEGNQTLADVREYLCDDGFLSFYDENIFFYVSRNANAIDLLMRISDTDPISKFSKHEIFVHITPKSTTNMPRVELYGCPNANIHDVESLRKKRKVTIRNI